MDLGSFLMRRASLEMDLSGEFSDKEKREFLSTLMSGV